MTTDKTTTYLLENQGKIVSFSLTFIGFIVELRNFKFWFMIVHVVFDNLLCIKFDFAFYCVDVIKYLFYIYP
jgi:hypothetical protein